jgi:hypothetical protein
LATPKERAFQPQSKELATSMGFHEIATLPQSDLPRNEWPLQQAIVAGRRSLGDARIGFVKHNMTFNKKSDQTRVIPF